MSDTPHIPPITTGVASSYDIPDDRHDVTIEAPEPQPYPGVEFSVERSLRERVETLENMVQQLWDQIMDKPIDIQGN